MDILKIVAGDHTILIELLESETTNDFISNLPLSLSMERYDDREYYATLDFHPSLNGKHIDDYKNGDAAYFPEYNTLAIFYAKEGVSSQPGLILIGRVISDLGDFDLLNEKVHCEISLK